MKQGRIQKRGRGERAPKAPSNFFYKHNTILSFAILQVYVHYGNVPFKRLALLGRYYFATECDNKTLSAVRTTMTEDQLEACILLQVHRDYIPEPVAFVDHFAGSGARRLRFVF